MTATQQSEPAESFVAKMAREKRERRARLGWPAQTMQRPTTVLAKPAGPQRVEIKEDPARDTRVEVVKLADQVIIVTASEIRAAKASFDPVNKSATFDRIKAEVCRRFRITQIEIEADRRDVKIVVPRQMAMFIAKKLTTKSLPTIGRYFGRRDHTTVLNACRRIEALIQTDPKIRRHYEVLMERLSGEAV